MNSEFTLAGEETARKAAMRKVDETEKGARAEKMKSLDAMKELRTYPTGQCFQNMMVPQNHLGALKNTDSNIPPSRPTEFMSLVIRI